VTGSPAALGLVSFAGALPLLLFTYFGGMIADRFDQRKILLVTTSLAMLEAFFLTFLNISGSLTVPWLVTLAVFLGCVSAIEVPTRQAFVSSLVPEKDLLNAIGLNSAIFNTSRLLGPLLAGLALGAFGENFCFLSNAVSYVAVLVTLRMLVVGSNTDRKKKTGAEQKADSDAVFATLLHDVRVRGILLLTFATALFGFPYATLLPVIAKDILHGNASTLAYLSAAAAVGGLIGSLSVARVKDKARLARLQALGAVAVALSIGLLGYSSTLLTSVITTCFAGLFMSVQFSGGNSLLQTSIDPKIRGRIMAVYMWAMLGSAPLAALGAGWLAEHFGVSITLAINAALLAVAGLLYLSRLPKQAKPNP
jgi:MFS family permease